MHGKNKKAGWAEGNEIQLQHFHNVRGLGGAAGGGDLLPAQWPEHPTEGPRTESGELDLKAPAPKAPDGHPDLSGVWQPMRLNFGQRKWEG